MDLRRPDFVISGFGVDVQQGRGRGVRGDC